MIRNFQYDCNESSPSNKFNLLYEDNEISILAFQTATFTLVVIFTAKKNLIIFVKKKKFSYSEYQQPFLFDMLSRKFFSKHEPIVQKNLYLDSCSTPAMSLKTNRNVTL